MNALDSRFIRLGNCFGHRFSQPGTFRYGLSPIPSSPTHAEESAGQEVIVREGSGGKQGRHSVSVSVVNGELTAHPKRVEVSAGDFVMWTPDNSVEFGFRVRGKLGSGLLDSASMRDESVFTHAFGLPGNFEWVDANGSPLHGSVRVTMPDTSGGHDEWLAKLEEGTLIHVKGDVAEPAQVEVLVGQTVVWAIEGAPGVSITDAALMGAAAPPS